MKKKHQAIESSGNCEDNYLEIRQGLESGAVVKKFCPGETDSLSTNYNGLYIKWVKQKDSSSSFSGKWTTTEVACCDKILIENTYSTYNGYYNLDPNTGNYLQESGNQVLVKAKNKNSKYNPPSSVSGWFISEDINKYIASIYNPVGIKV